MTSPPERPQLARGATRLALDAVEQLTHLVEAMHANIAAASLPLGKGTDGRTRGVTGLVYDSIRLVNSGVRAALDRGLGLLPGPLDPALPQPHADALLAALNGVLGDHLAASGNPLAIAMQLRHGGEALPLEREALTRQLEGANARVLLLIHGLCMNGRHWTRGGHDHGAALARDLGMTPLYLLYNTGRHVSENGRELAALFDTLLASWPVAGPELVIVGHSMGGLVARSACREATSRATRGSSDCAASSSSARGIGHSSCVLARRAGMNVMPRPHGEPHGGAERRALFDHIAKQGLAEVERAELFAEIERRATLDEVVASATTRQRAVELYAASRLAIEPDSAAERGHLALLAARPGADDAVVAGAEQEAAAEAAHASAAAERSG